VYNDIGIGAYGGAEQGAAADSLIQDAVEREFVRRGAGREITLTAAGARWCRERCR
jgi:hypothetical protein